jgi:hypothetical protein
MSHILIVIFLWFYVIFVNKHFNTIYVLTVKYKKYVIRIY